METFQPILSNETVFRLNEPLRGKTTLKVGGVARYYSEPAHLEDLRLLLQEASKKQVAVFFLGRGSNLLALDGDINCLVVSLRHPVWRKLVPVGENGLRAGAGLRLRELCIQASQLGLSGFEFLEGIPGTLGGALRMNAGAMGGWMLDVVEEVRLFDRNGVEKVLRREDLHFGYRHCEELRDACAVEAVLRASGRAETGHIRQTISSFQAHRYASQPKEPSAGCIFKNPDGDSAGRLIDHLGLKGTTCGAAEVSAIHGNFIVNKGGATSQDVVELVRRVRAEVHRRSGILLEPEVLLLGADWGELL
jgi:UDP-N-acetylenolpyruvoylglucosamine reductase